MSTKELRTNFISDYTNRLHNLYFTLELEISILTLGMDRPSRHHGKLTGLCLPPKTTKDKCSYSSVSPIVLNPKIEPLSFLGQR